jgi:hypothetical protein
LRSGQRAGRVSTTSLVSFDRNRYSVACQAAGKTAQLRSYAGNIIVIHERACIAEHPRAFQREQLIFDPWRRLKHYPDWDRQLVDIPAHLQLKEPPLADYARYDHFRKDSADATR